MNSFKYSFQHDTISPSSLQKSIDTIIQISDIFKGYQFLILTFPEIDFAAPILFPPDRKTLNWVLKEAVDINLEEEGRNLTSLTLLVEAKSFT